MNPPSPPLSQAIDSPEGTVSLRDDAGGLWRVTPDFVASLTREILPRLAEPELIPGASPIKSSMARRVVRITRQGALPVIFKTYHVRSWFERCKYALRPSRAMAEWRAARLLASLGVPTARPLAVGERREGPILRAAYYVCEAIEDASALGPWLEERFRPGDGHLAEKLAAVHPALRSLATLHSAGWLHADFHGGNILLGRDSASGPAAYLVDLHSLHRFTLSAARAHRRDLTDFLFSLRYVLDASERREAALLYRALSGEDDTPVPAFLELLERALQAREELHWRSRGKRCVKESSQFTCAHVAEGRLYRRRAFSVAAVREALVRHDAEVARGGSGLIGLSRRTAVTRVRLAPQEGGGTEGSIVVKEFSKDRRWIGRRSLRAWRGAHHLCVRELATPLALACLLARNGRGYLLTEDAAPAAPLDIHLYRVARLPDARHRLRRLAMALGECVAALWQRRLVHADLSAKNILVGGDDLDPDILLVDTGDVRTVRRVRRRLRARALIQLGDLPAFVDRELKRRFLARLSSKLRDRSLWALVPEIERGVERRIRRAGTSVRAMRAEAAEPPSRTALG
ncbi:MAG: lipopolysaccharide kinase InaA family protein [Planctomycetota bacterium]